MHIPYIPCTSREVTSVTSGNCCVKKVQSFWHDGHLSDFTELLSMIPSWLTDLETQWWIPPCLRISLVCLSGLKGIFVFDTLLGEILLPNDRVAEYFDDPIWANSLSKHDGYSFCFIEYNKVTCSQPFLSAEQVQHTISFEAFSDRTEKSLGHWYVQTVRPSCRGKTWSILP